MELKYRHTPSALYKYRSFSQYSLNNLCKDEVWFNKASQLNDPHDCAWTMNTVSDLKENILKATLKTLPDAIQKIGIKVWEEEIKRLEGKGYKETMEYILCLDPIIGQNKAGMKGFVEEVEKWLEQICEEHIQSLSDSGQEGMFITCFSEENDSILMWSHYADNHKGFCVELKSPG